MLTQKEYKEILELLDMDCEEDENGIRHYYCVPEILKDYIESSDNKPTKGEKK